MNLGMKFKSIMQKWFFYIFIVVALVVSIATVAFSSLYNSLYVEKIEAISIDYSEEFSSLYVMNFLLQF